MSIHVEDEELDAAQKQLCAALGVDHEGLRKKAELASPFPCAASLCLGVMEAAWLRRLKTILPGPASSIEMLRPCVSSESDDEDLAYPFSVCVLTNHGWEQEPTDRFRRAESECQAISEKLAELLAAVPGPIHQVDVIPCCHDSNLAEVSLKRSEQQQEVV